MFAIQKQAAKISSIQKDESVPKIMKGTWGLKRQVEFSNFKPTKKIRRCSQLETVGLSQSLAKQHGPRLHVCRFHLYFEAGIEMWNLWTAVAKLYLWVGYLHQNLLVNPVNPSKSKWTILFLPSSAEKYGSYAGSYAATYPQWGPSVVSWFENPMN